MSTYIYEAVASELGGETVKRTDSEGNVVWIPTDPENADYQKYLESQKEA